MSPRMAATEDRAPRASASQPPGLRAAATGARTPRVCAPQQEQPPRGDARAPMLEHSPRLPQLEKARVQQRRRRAAINK